METFEVVVPREERGKRLDRFLAALLPAFSRASLQTFIRKGNCTCNGALLTHPDYTLKAGEAITLRLPQESADLAAEEGPVDILWHDDVLCVVNKPPNLTVHPCPSCPQGTLIQRLLPLFPGLATMDGQRPGIVHRIDKDTSGLLLVALSEESRLALTEQFASRAIHKTYLALVAGIPAEEGECHKPIGRHPTQRTKMAIRPEEAGGKSAHTFWRRLWVADDRSTSLLAIQITTGRTHQIRVHMAEMGFPLLGDCVYAQPQVKMLADRQMLHAAKLSFTHPKSGEVLNFQSSPPEDFLKTALAHTRKTQRIVLCGNPGSGKSTVLAAFGQKGIPTFSADAAVTKLYAPSGALVGWLSGHGGSDIVGGNGTIDRGRLFARFKEDPIFKRELEHWVHRAVWEDLQSFWQETSGYDQACAEVPLWFECGFCDADVLTVFVRAPQDVRFARLAATRGWSVEKSATIESWQWPEAKKEAASDYVCDNSKERESTAQEIEKLLQMLSLRQKETLDAARKAFFKALEKEVSHPPLKDGACNAPEFRVG